MAPCDPPGSSVHGIYWQEYWSGLPFPTPGDLPDPGIRLLSPVVPALAGRFSTRVTWEAQLLSSITLLVSDEETQARLGREA